MSNDITLQDIYNLFKESEQERLKSKADFDRRMAKAEQERLQSKADFDRRMAESKAEADRSKAQADRSKAEADRSMEELRHIIKEGNRRMNDISDRWGRFVENLVRPGLETLFQERGIDVQETHPRMQSRRQGAAMEIDIFVVNGDTAIVVEVKSHLTQGKVNEFLDKLPRFKQAFPLYKHYQIHGAIAGIEVEPQAARYAYKQGLFVIVQAGEMVKFANDEQFKPKSW